MNAADPDRACPHLTTEAWVDVARLTPDGSPDAPVTAFSAAIKISCHDCGEQFRWIGVPAGLLPDRPACSVDEFELRAPIRPASSDPDFGMGIPGFAIRQVQ